MSEKNHVTIDIWSDYVCPYCYLELPVLEELQSTCDREITINWHAFELRPYPNPTLPPDGDYLKTVWANSVYPIASERGMSLKLPPIQPYSKDALAAAEFAKRTPHFDAFHAAMFKAFFVDGKDISDRGIIKEVARESGLDPKEVSGAIDHSSFRETVDRSLQEGLALGAQGVPAIFLTDTVTGKKVRVPGAASLAMFRAAIEKLDKGQDAA
ncbi:DsbA family oxidoreductase [Tritonibacter mobilis]|uniref:DsbA family oxidoreductase n=1 Tax=Tritonibacter mobilis TaxID=379347 RepID=UPI003A5C1510